MAGVSPTEALRVTRLRKRYDGKDVVAGIDFAVPRGSCFGLLGPNGAGKTTTLRCCLGLTPADGGTIRLGAFAVPEAADRARRHVGVVPQFDNLDPDFSVVENLSIYGRYFGLAPATIRERIPYLLEFSGLAGRETTRIQTLSGGMKRRLTLARALINDPDILFLDEPTTGLDPQARHLIWDRLQQLTAQGKTLVLTTHFMEEAERLCDRVAILDEGRIVSEGAPDELVRAHIEPQVVEVFGDDARAWAERFGALGERLEVSGETAFFYCRDTTALVAELSRTPYLRHMHRAANLEDVFIKLTGRELRD